MTPCKILESVEKLKAFTGTVTSKEMSPFKELNIECTLCHVTGSTHSLAHSSPQTPKMVERDG